jgi:hypothetical protein
MSARVASHWSPWMNPKTLHFEQSVGEYGEYGEYGSRYSVEVPEPILIRITYDVRSANA